MTCNEIDKKNHYNKYNQSIIQNPQFFTSTFVTFSPFKNDPSKL